MSRPPTLPGPVTRESHALSKVKEARWVPHGLLPRKIHQRGTITHPKLQTINMEIKKELFVALILAVGCSTLKANLRGVGIARRCYWWNVHSHHKSHRVLGTLHCIFEVCEDN